LASGGFHIVLQRGGQRIKHKRVQRVHRAAELCVRRIRRKRLTRSYTRLTTLSAVNRKWALICQRCYGQRSTLAHFQRGGHLSKAARLGIATATLDRLLHQSTINIRDKSYR